MVTVLCQAISDPVAKEIKFNTGFFFFCINFCLFEYCVTRLFVWITESFGASLNFESEAIEEIV